MMDAFQKQCLTPSDRPSAGSMLIVEDDVRLLQCFAQAMEVRGFKVIITGSVWYALAQIQLSAPEYAVVDLRLDDGCGLGREPINLQGRSAGQSLYLAT
jgi:ActR/RegA family two-component response regulator